MVSGRPIAAAGTTTLEELPSKTIELLNRVWKHLRRHGVSKTGHNVVVYLDDRIQVEAGVEVFDPIPEGGGVRMSATTSGQAATTVHWGPYPGLPKGHQAVRERCKEHGHPLAGPNWDVYCDWNNDPQKLRTDAFYLLKVRRAGQSS